MEGFYIVLGGTVIIALIGLFLALREDHPRKIRN